MRASIRQVAESAKVSPMTVSRVLRGKGVGYSPQTAEVVLNAVRDLNYAPVRAGLQNRHVETRVLGILHEDDSGLETHPVAAGMLAGLRAEARRQDYDLLLLLRAGPQWGSERGDAVFLDRRADGLIFLNPRNVETAITNLAKTDIPFVCCWEDAPEGVVCVTTDSKTITHLAVRHLVELGHRRIAHLAGDQAHPAGRARCKAFRAEMQYIGLPCPAESVVFGHWAIEAAVDEADARKVLAWRPTAVVCGNDFQALALLRAAEAMGLRVPRDLSIVGVDNVPGAREHGLTTVNSPFAQIGEMAVRSLLKLMRGEPWQSCDGIVPVHLVERSSTAAPAK